MSMSIKSVAEQLAPTGVLRAGINMSNFLLVTNSDDSGNPVGVSPDVASAIAQKLNVDLKLIPYKGPGQVADGAVNQEWDIANIAAEAERAKTISFSPAYCEIQATYLLPAGSALVDINDVDQPGIRIAVKQRAAYDLWLTENLKHATLVRTESMDDSLNAFKDQSLDALAGLRPRLAADAAELKGSTVMDASFTAVQQSIGCLPNMPAANAFLEQFVEESISSGFIESLIKKHNVVGKLSVASPLRT